MLLCCSLHCTFCLTIIVHNIRILAYMDTAMMYYVFVTIILLVRHATTVQNILILIVQTAMTATV